MDLHPAGCHGQGKGSEGPLAFAPQPNTHRQIHPRQSLPPQPAHLHPCSPRPPPSPVHPLPHTSPHLLIAPLCSLFLVFEYCEHDLGRLLDALPSPAFSISEVKCLLRQLLEAVAYLHDRCECGVKVWRIGQLLEAVALVAYLHDWDVPS